MTKQSAAEARDQMVKTLRLALHGPEGDDLEKWPGFTDDVRVVTDGQEFLSDFQMGLPMQDGLGNEVLARPPAFLYGIGILYPKMTAQQNSELTQKQQIPDDDEVEAAPEEIKASVPTVEDAPSSLSEDNRADDEAPTATEEKIGRPRSLAVSIHVPSETNSFEVLIDGATYEPISVSITSKRLTFWKRNPFHLSVTLPASETAEEIIEQSGLKLRVGLTSQVSPTGEKLSTLFVVNETTANEAVSQSCLFQSKISVKTESLLPYPRLEMSSDSTDESFSLLYRHHPVMSIGHGCDSKSELVEGIWVVSSDVLPVVTVQSPNPNIVDPNGNSYNLGMLDLARLESESLNSVETMISDYSKWIENKRSIGKTLSDTHHSETANRHMDLADEFLADIKYGWDLVRTNPEVGRVFQWTCVSMNAQRTAASADIRRANERLDSESSFVYTDLPPQGTPDFQPNFRNFGFGELSNTNQGTWRPFQLAFLLSSIAQLVDKSHPKREQVDIIWMPTGGGKTEAYLALAAFTMLWERMQEVSSGIQPSYRVSVMMRYTLKLLTTQQVLRASALMCALEIIRETFSEMLDGQKKIHFRIGAWLGGSSTPNTWQEAVRDFTNLAGGRKADRTFLLAKCPWCSAEMGVAIDGKLAGYSKKALKLGNKTHIEIYCPDSTCPFSKQEGPFNRLPVLEVDEDIYSQPPTFLVGTIDKFAVIAWKEDARRLFGLNTRNGQVDRQSPPPDLMIQDELHLIAGPLGSMDALYEIALEALCTMKGGKKPRIVAATATTKNFETQVERLYGRNESRLLPPSGIEIEDNFFAKSPDSTSSIPGKTYVGICASGLGTVVESQLRVVAALYHGAACLEQEDSDYSDAWWTNLAFFNSRRSLGLQLAAIQASLRMHTWSLTQRSGVRTGPLKSDGIRASVRNISQVRELTATSGENISRLMNALSYDKTQKGHIDLCFATSMIEVGVDVTRLGLMTVMGQPKSSSQYIQVTGRVGRSDNAPGLVVVVLSPYNVRDRSHFENFRQNHQRMYAAVESVSVTPYTAQALERAASGMLTTVLRASSLTDPVSSLNTAEFQNLIEDIRRRASSFGDNHAAEAVEVEISRLIQSAEAAARLGHSSWEGNGLLLKAGDTAPASEDFDHWIVPMSMRSVELESGLRVMSRPRASQKLSSLAIDTASGQFDGEDLF